VGCNWKTYITGDQLWAKSKPTFEPGSGVPLGLLDVCSMLAGCLLNVFFDVCSMSAQCLLDCVNGV